MELVLINWSELLCSLLLLLTLREMLYISTPLIPSVYFNQAWSYQVNSTIPHQFPTSMFASCGRVPAFVLTNYLLIILFCL